MARRTKRPKPPTTTNGAPTPTSRPDLREHLLADFATLKVPLTAAQLDALLARAERGGLSHLEFAHALLAEQARQRRERAIAGRIRDAKFPCRRSPNRLRSHSMRLYGLMALVIAHSLSNRSFWIRANASDRLHRPHRLKGDLDGLVQDHAWLQCNALHKTTPALDRLGPFGFPPSKEPIRANQGIRC
jgi:hypothetical protein